MLDKIKGALFRMAWEALNKKCERLTAENEQLRMDYDHACTVRDSQAVHIVEWQQRCDALEARAIRAEARAQEWEAYINKTYGKLASCKDPDANRIMHDKALVGYALVREDLNGMRTYIDPRCVTVWPTPQHQQD